MIEIEQPQLLEVEIDHKALCKIEEEAIKRGMRFVKHCYQEARRIGKDERLEKFREVIEDGSN